MKKIYSLCISAVLIFTGCNDDFLTEVHPTKLTSEALFETNKGVEEATIGLYRYSQYSIGRDATGYLATFDILRGDELTLPKKFGSNVIVQWLTLNYNPETAKVNEVWARSYETIFRANSIIDNVAENNSISDDTKKKALAEAYAMRGYCYFNLTRLFQEVPLVLHQTTPENYYPKKSLEAECWNQVFSDYEKALEIGLPNPVSNYLDGRLNTGVVNALMARAYLLRTRPGSIKYWDKIKEFTDAVEKLNIYDLESIDNFGTLFVYTKDDKWVYNQEVIWATGNHYGPIFGGSTFRYEDESDLGSYVTMPNGQCTYTLMNNLGTTFLPGNGMTGTTFFAVNPDLADLMIDYDSLGDKRVKEDLYYPTYKSYKLDFNYTTYVQTIVEVKTVNSAEEYSKIKTSNGVQGEYLHIKKYRIRECYGKNIWDGGWHHSVMFPVIRYADVLLMRAEAEYNLGNITNAKLYLKKITDRAGFAANYLDQFSGQALLDEILNQSYPPRQV
jgi:hypothetical protein